MRRFGDDAICRKTVWYWNNKIHTIGVDGHEIFDLANPEDRFKVSTI